MFLFVLGLFLYKGKDKWWIIAGTVLAILMAVGNHFMVFTKLCFKILPLYNKFRTVSMALVILQVTLPVLGFLTLDHIVKDGYDRKAFLKKSGLAFALTGGFCLLFYLIPTLAGDFTSMADAGQPEVVIEAFQADRIALLRQDALISFFLILAAWGIFSLISSMFSPKEMPGVTISVTPRLTSFFANFGSSSWSQMATLKPARTSLVR